MQIKDHCQNVFAMAGRHINNSRPSKKVFKAYHALCCLHQAKGKNKRLCQALLSDPTTLDAFSECTFNVLKGNAPIGSKTAKKLKKFRKPLEFLVNKGKGRKKKFKILTAPGQKGGFLISAILSAVLPILSRLFFGKNVD
ncbi:MAG: hypothetical protein GY858_05455 [Candidatus Omnitrophica bacterium]|nr:hypothetical protein [Candidatus Omnitrophota bacterium]